MEKRLNKLILIIGDIILINIGYILALYIRFDGVIDKQFLSYLPRFLDNAVYISILKILVFIYFKMYKTIWKYASIEELLNIVTAIIASNTVVLSFFIYKTS